MGINGTIVIQSTGDSTDRTVDIQSALDSGNHIHFASGTYHMAGSVRIPSNRLVTGVSGATTILRSGSQNNLFRNNNTAVALYGGNKNITIHGIKFDAGTNTSSCTLVAIGHSENVIVDDCEFTRVRDWHGVELNAVKNGIVKNCRFYSFAVTGGGDEEMLQFDNMGTTGRWVWETDTTVYDKTPCLDIVVDSCSFRNGATGIGSHSYEAGFLHKNVKITNCTFDTLSYYGVRDVTGEKYTIENCNFRGVVVTGVAHLVNAATAWKVANCQFTSMGGRGVQLEYVRGVSVVACGFDTVESHACGIDFSYDASVDSCQFDAVKDVSVFIFKTTGAVVSNCCINGGGANQSATEADITIGSTASDVKNTADVIVQGCRCADIYVRQYTNKTIVNNCVVTGAITNSSGANFKSGGNYVAGTWVGNV